MGKKYRDLKQRLQQIPGRALLIIDDAKIRRSAFGVVEKILRKIDTLEKKIKDFSDADSQLYESWHQLTFKNDLSRISKAQDQFKLLVKLHNSIVGYSQQYSVSMIEAYRAIKEEELRWAKASDAEREMYVNTP